MIESHKEDVLAMAEFAHCVVNMRQSDNTRPVIYRAAAGVDEIVMCSDNDGLGSQPRQPYLKVFNVSLFLTDEVIRLRAHLFKQRANGGEPIFGPARNGLKLALKILDGGKGILAT